MSDKTKKVQMVKSAMIEIYGEHCWMGYTICRDNPFTYHHIKEKRFGGKVTLENGALLTSYAHADLNTLEHVKPYYYNKLNSMFMELNATLAPPTKEYYEEINDILLHASKYVKLSKYFNPILLDEDYNADETTIFIPERYKELHTHKPMYIPDVEIPIEYRDKVKTKNRNSKLYKYY